MLKLTQYQRDVLLKEAKEYAAQQDVYGVWSAASFMSGHILTRLEKGDLPPEEKPRESITLTLTADQADVVQAMVGRIACPNTDPMAELYRTLDKRSDRKLLTVYSGSHLKTGDCVGSLYTRAH